MPLIPEKLSSRQDVKSAIACQFWEQPSHSPRSIDGQVWSLPCEPPALNLTGSSGLSRTQQLLAAQALGLPAAPSYDADCEGLVLDRILTRLGGKRWWVAVGGRTKVQRMWKRGPGAKDKLQALQDLNNYGAVARGRFQLGRRLTLNGVVESRSLTQLQQRVNHQAATATAAVRRRLSRPARSGQAAPTPDSAAAFVSSDASSLTVEEAIVQQPSDGLSPALQLDPLPLSASGLAGLAAVPASPLTLPASPTGPGSSRSSSQRPAAKGDGELLRAHGTLKCSLPGHDLTATAGYQQDYVDSSGEYAHVPLALSLDLASQYRPDGLQYRVGLHQVTAPAIEGSSKAASRLRTTLHVQGAVAVEGEAHIWKPAVPAASQAQQQQQEKQAGAVGTIAVGAAGAPGAAGPSSAGPASGAVPGGPQAGAAGQARDAPSGQTPSSRPSGSEAAPAQQQGVASTEAAAPPGTRQPQEGTESDDAGPASRVATALESAARADAGLDLEPEASQPQGPARRAFRKRSLAAGAAQGMEEGSRGPGSPREPPPPPQQQQQQQQKQQHEQLQQRSSPHPQQPRQHPNVGSGPPGRGDGSPSGPAVEPGSGSSSSQQGNPGADSSASAGGGHGQTQDMLASGQPAAAAAAAATAAAAAAGAAAEGAGAALESFIKPLGELLHTVTHPRDEGGASGGTAGGGGGGSDSQQGPGDLLSISAKSIQAGIQESLALLEQVRANVARLTSDVQEGSLQRMSQQLADSSGRAREAAAPRRRPYSVFLSQPHFKLNGSMGCLARMPLPPLRGFGPPLGVAGLHPLPPGAGSSNSLSSLGSVAQAWESYLKGTSLRLFASGGISGQLGRFTRPFLDYTAVALRADVGLTSPHVVGLLPDPAALDASDTHRPDKHRAFALEGRGSWHSLSASLAQQVFGPVRARADFRFALDPTNMPQNAGERSTIKGLVQTALSVRPSLLEAVFGFDVVLPGTEGAARLACWWSPHRREAMAELRLF